MLEEEDTVLTHEGYLRNVIQGMLRDCQTMKTLSGGRNITINQVTEKLEEVCHKSLEELEGYPLRMKKDKWVEEAKNRDLR